MDPEGLRRFLADGALSAAEAVPGVVSLNLVGSFADTDDISAIGDIDTVVILDHLTEGGFEAVLGHFRSLAAPLQERFGLSLRINSTFGPLKFNEPGTVVFHVMIYDVAGHILHARKSPFTCYDWQRSRLCAGIPLRDLHPVRRLMPGHFTGARRGVREYLRDYERGAVSYRLYRFADGEAREETAEKPMDAKDRQEFAFHILRFVMGNFLKLVDGANSRPPDGELLERFLSWFPALGPELPAWFRTLRERKRANRFPAADPDLDAFVRRFLEEFEAGFRIHFPERGAVRVIRHLRTGSNDGRTFLGPGSDPPILPAAEAPPLLDAGAVYASPARRALESAFRWAPGINPQVTPALREIDYGRAEGRDADWLAVAHPEIASAWAAGADPRFPGGENHADVCARIDAFLASLPDAGNPVDTLVVTHNVWIRCLLGRMLGIEPRDWFRMAVPHGLPFTLRRNPAGGFLPDLDAGTLQTLLAPLEEHALLARESLRDPHAVERHAFWRGAHRDRRGPVGLKLPGTCLIPMAGAGARFSSAGFATPKPLIPVDGEPMILRSVQCLPRLDQIAYLIRSGPPLETLGPRLRKTHPRATLVPVDGLTQGQACTCLLGTPGADPGQPLLIAPCDNGMAWDEAAFAALIADPAVDAVCWTFTRHLAIRAQPEAWGYVSADANGRCRSVSVKRPLTGDPFTEDCLIGTFWFRTARLFEELARELVGRERRVNGEFYVDSVMELAIQGGLDVRRFRVDRYLSWGRPEDLREYRRWMALERVLDPAGTGAADA